MDDFPEYQVWQKMLNLLTLVSSPLAAVSEGEGTSKRTKGTAAVEARRPANTTSRQHVSAHIRILERSSRTSVVVSWSDSTTGRYDDQIWKLGVARCGDTCALTGATIRRGDVIYRPYARGRSPANANWSILASAL